MSDVAHAFIESPQYRRGAMFINYDEWGGFFDHVKPRRVPDDRANRADLDNDWSITGFRVPAVAISPYTRARRGSGRVSHMTCTHESILKLISYRYGLGHLTKRHRYASNIGRSFDFSKRDFEPPELPDPAAIAAVPCSVGGSGRPKAHDLVAARDLGPARPARLRGPDGHLRLAVSLSRPRPAGLRGVAERKRAPERGPWFRKDVPPAIPAAGPSVLQPCEVLVMPIGRDWTYLNTGPVPWLRFSDGLRITWSRAVVWAHEPAARTVRAARRADGSLALSPDRVPRRLPAAPRRRVQRQVPRLPDADGDDLRPGLDPRPVHEPRERAPARAQLRARADHGRALGAAARGRRAPLAAQGDAAAVSRRADARLRVGDRRGRRRRDRPLAAAASGSRSTRACRR